MLIFFSASDENEFNLAPRTTGISERRDGRPTFLPHLVGTASSGGLRKVISTPPSSSTTSAAAGPHRARGEGGPGGSDGGRVLRQHLWRRWGGNDDDKDEDDKDEKKKRRIDSEAGIKDADEKRWAPTEIRMNEFINKIQV